MKKLLILLIWLFSPYVIIIAQQEQNQEVQKGTFTDERDGQVYEWVKIGDQIWMAQNLNIGKIIYMRDNKIVDGSIERFCYDNLDKYCVKYGGLYTDHVVDHYITKQGPKGICPEGWHIPTESEWLKLFDSLGGREKAGGALKQTGKIYQGREDKTATNSSGFSSMPGGMCIYDEYGIYYMSVGKTATYWSSTEMFSLIYFRKDYRILLLQRNKDKVTFSRSHGMSAVSVRCVKDGK
jgi:uncharacterized protein (TIGR02145 family)